MMSRRTKILIGLIILFFLALAVCYVCRCSIVAKDSPMPDCTDGVREMSSYESDKPVAWMELPAIVSLGKERSVVTHKAQMEGRTQRNYTILYDEELYAALWVAYPLCASHTSKGREETWAYDPHVPQSAQTSVKAGYGASEPTQNYPKNFYARGHQIPNADRSAVLEMQAQTY